LFVFASNTSDPHPPQGGHSAEPQLVGTVQAGGGDIPRKQTANTILEKHFGVLAESAGIVNGNLKKNAHRGKMPQTAAAGRQRRRLKHLWLIEGT